MPTRARLRCRRHDARAVWKGYACAKAWRCKVHELSSRVIHESPGWGSAIKTTHATAVDPTIEASPANAASPTAVATLHAYSIL
mmetsp:Transcript_19111/g.31995  ORF Transcript_19111/g.31995 Transcript_19111/m.31995 type:complete len:84 (-) Transcript_19111:47-298(-)